MGVQQDTTHNNSQQTEAVLALADGSIFRGISIGAAGHRVGEVVFNTSMTGYQEILTDPSYAKQIVTLTYPHIGNTGTNSEDAESGNIDFKHQVWAEGLIIRDATMTTSNFRNSESLSDYLTRQETVAIAEIDTRKLTRILRDKGAQNGCIMTASNGETLSDDDIEKALELAKGFAGLEGMDLAKECTHPDGFEWTAGTWELADRGVHGVTESETGGYYKQLGEHIEHKYDVVAYDFGTKTNILRMLVDIGCKVTVVPATTPIADVLAMNPDGIFLSNGPGDPAACGYAIEAVRHIIEETNVPTFGICLGHQLVGLASGAKTMKMKTGHHGANHPVQDLETQKVMITSQNHGFAIDESTLPDNVKPTHRSLFDGTNQGIELTNKPVFSFQGHPEASPGPHDAALLFNKFAQMLADAKS
ncbi:glutamine-hydrolyzing carbamoyl-phosphate synthase small subunit [Psychrobacter sp. FDAARGOS_221]|uniref:glutamine-hydrolyzing carbamoyl-phosphate synthase small subunit n=1 Tax=Psychrobacter sp. FDAARGOS_221 TaxID=1975705 RepID=UPI000BB57E73|nr:glutamine-hydrolyzing carbamoyl-phosphate synthase small subunit [Psychrobacter sp. FDAARGOS_221]PNK61601.1 carbamoyl-phosphate synthase small subunit [Psychrobacter sp. FDAARGOS_221]